MPGSSLMKQTVSAWHGGERKRKQNWDQSLVADLQKRPAHHPHVDCMNYGQIKEETNEKECCDISRTIQRNVSNYFILVAVSLFFNAHHKEKSCKIIFNIFVYVS